MHLAGVCLWLTKPSTRSACPMHGAFLKGRVLSICCQTSEQGDRRMANGRAYHVLMKHTCFLQCLRVSSGDRVAAVKWLLPPDGAEVAMFTAEVDFVSRKGPAGRGPAMEVDSSLLNQHLLSRFSSQVPPAIPATCFVIDLKHMAACMPASQPVSVDIRKLSSKFIMRPALNYLLICNEWKGLRP